MEGVAAETVARSQAKARFQIMFMGIMSSELRVPRPCLSWVPDTLEERTDAVEKLAEINKYWEGKMEQQIKLAETPGTEEYMYMRKTTRISQRQAEKGVVGYDLEKLTKSIDSSHIHEGERQGRERSQREESIGFHIERRFFFL